MTTLFCNMRCAFRTKSYCIRYGLRTEQRAISEWIILTWIPPSFAVKKKHKRWWSQELEHKEPESLCQVSSHWVHGWLIEVSCQIKSTHAGKLIKIVDLKHGCNWDRGNYFLGLYCACISQGSVFFFNSTQYKAFVVVEKTRLQVLFSIFISTWTGNGWSVT